MKTPKAIARLTHAFEKLPGIGPKTAQRLTFYLLHFPQGELDKFSKAFSNLKRKTKICSLCFNVAETDPCEICTDVSRKQNVICVVEEPLNILAIERSDGYRGLYHVLHGAISPLNNIGPDELHLRDLLPRLKGDKIREIILATNPTMEGEATAMYIKKMIQQETGNTFDKLSAGKRKKTMKITRIGRGLPTGGDLEYADEVTLANALKGRREF